MKWTTFYSYFTIFAITLLCLDLCKSASIGKYERFTGEQGLYSQKDDVEILTVDNFKDAIINSNKAWVVEFYNSWCGFCQKFAPSWKEFATDVRGWKDLVVIAAMDCSNEQNHPVCRDYEIMAYPTLRYYPEGFQEEEKNYGFSLDRGVTAKDHRDDLLRKIIKEQVVGRGRHFPNLLPYISSDIEKIFAQSSSDVLYSILIIQEHNSLLGPQIAMDLHKTTNIVTHYSPANNTDLVTSLKTTSYPSIYLIGRDKNVQHVKTLNNDVESLKEAIKDALKQKHIDLLLTAGRQDGIDLYERSQENDALIKKVKKMGDVIFQMDLETALRYSLKREIGGSKEISGEKLEALKKYISVLAKYFPFGRNGKAFLNQIDNYVNSSPTVYGSEFSKLVDSAENENSLVFSSPKHWLGCKGSSGQYRGFPCGMWKLFHYLTVNVADYEQGLRGDNPRLALEAMHGYIKHFFGCADCSKHFQEMAERRKLQNVSSFDDSILWLWMAHNEVNKRLSGDLSEDPEFPKIQFPSQDNCPACHKPDGSWNEPEVLKYLKHMYSSINIRYLGSDTRIIHMGLDGNYNSTQEGLQEEAVQIQARPVRKSLVNGTTDGGDASLAPAKDKTLFMLPLFSVLTILYVKKFILGLNF
ncbi:sulfhydryl oxidase 2-like [Sitophilus oryzae]|uniref:Sulfhydryl oxidase n=1 Tax=Sitophilus oryzae TaxID=7048 RepID=A0A6J2YQU8_SITOR|nr:sulfhydryl oxidase 2-like [Sitophilus oryzae]